MWSLQAPLAVTLSRVAEGFQVRNEIGSCKSGVSMIQSHSGIWKNPFLVAYWSGCAIRGIQGTAGIK